jgi:hypothetical protein
MGVKAGYVWGRVATLQSDAEHHAEADSGPMLQRHLVGCVGHMLLLLLPTVLLLLLLLLFWWWW